MAAKGNTKRGLLPGYFESMQQKESKERYLEKLKSIEGQDPYEISRKEWIDDVDCWPDVTYINVGMYLLFSPSSYTQEQLMNYKSLDCYQNFANGWVREVLCKKFGENRLLIAKVQLQLFCTAVLKYIDVVIWTEKALFSERIFPDKNFWEQNVPRAKEFFLRGILPELIGRWFSRPTPGTQRTVGPENPVSHEAGEGSSSDRPPVPICYCRGGEYGQMVACDNDNCLYQWFHLDCLKLKSFPKSKTWFCPECQKQRRGKYSRAQRAD